MTEQRVNMEQMETMVLTGLMYKLEKTVLTVRLDEMELTESMRRQHRWR